MSSDHPYTPEEAASVALARWNDEAMGLHEEAVQSGVPSVYLTRAREDAALSAFGDFAPVRAQAEAAFRDGVELYLKHQRAGTEQSEFFVAFTQRLDQVVPGIAGVELGKPGAIMGDGFWTRLEHRVDGARAVFAGDGRATGLLDLRRQNAAIFTSAVVTAGELVGRGRVSKEAVLPVRMLEGAPTVGAMRASAVALRCATGYNRALESVLNWKRDAEALCSRVKVTQTTGAIVPVLVSSRGAMSVTEIKDASGVAYNTAGPFLERLKEMGLVMDGGTGDRMKTFVFAGIRDREAVAGRRRGTPAAAPLPADRATEAPRRAKGR